MLTNNYKGMVSGAYSLGELLVPMKDITGTYRGSRQFDSGYAFLYSMKRQYTTSRKYGIVFGSGTTSPTKEDYTLEQLIAETDIEVTPPSAITVIDGSDYFEYQAAYTVKALAPLTISEIGVYDYIYAKTSVSPNSGYSMYTFLTDRTLLETPITLSANETAEITYKLRFYY